MLHNAAQQKGISGVRGIMLDPESVETNIVYFNLDPDVIALDAFVTEMDKFGIVLQGA